MNEGKKCWIKTKAELLDISYSHWQLEGPTALFELKIWVYRILQEVEFWSKMVITTVQALPTAITNKQARTAPVRATRSARR